MARIFAARQSSPGSSTVVFTVSLSVRFAANTLSSVDAHAAARQEANPVIRMHTFTSTHLYMQAQKRLYGFTGAAAGTYRICASGCGRKLPGIQGRVLSASHAR